MPVSLACLCCSLVSSCSWRLITSSLVAGVLETLCTHCWPPSLQSRGGRIELRISSVFWSLWVSTDGSFALGGLGTGPPLPITATALCWPAFGVRTYTQGTYWHSMHMYHAAELLKVKNVLYGPSSCPCVCWPAEDCHTWQEKRWEESNSSCLWSKRTSFL